MFLSDRGKVVGMMDGESKLDYSVDYRILPNSSLSYEIINEHHTTFQGAVAETQVVQLGAMSYMRSSM